MPDPTDRPQAAEVCVEHYWAWIHVGGARRSARICMLCHLPDADWLNHIVEVEPDTCTANPCVQCEFAEVLDPRNPPGQEQ